MSLARTRITTRDTQTTAMFSPRPRLFFIRGPRIAARLLHTNPKRPSNLTCPAASHPPTRVTPRGHPCYVVPPTCS